jgi:hypothetical protein
MRAVQIGLARLVRSPCAMSLAHWVGAWHTARIPHRDSSRLAVADIDRLIAWRLQVMHTHTNCTRVVLKIGCMALASFVHTRTQPPPLQTG